MDQALNREVQGRVRNETALALSLIGLGSAQMARRR